MRTVYIEYLQSYSNIYFLHVHMYIRGRCKQIFYHFLRPWHRNLVAQEIARDNLVKMDEKKILRLP